MKKTIRDFEVKGKKVLVRCDFNVPMQEGKITDTSRIDGAIPTIKYILENEGKAIIMSHKGRPKGEPNEGESLKPVAAALENIISEAMGKPVNVAFADSDVVVDESVVKKASELENGEILLLENTRFRKEETINEEKFSKELASLGDIFVNDAFGTAHRAHCSTVGVANYIPSALGFLLEKEVEYLGHTVENPERPFVGIIGGSKVGDKILVIESFLNKVDSLIIGGGMAYTFYKAMGLEIGTSILDADNVELAKGLIQQAKEKGVSLMLPTDVLCAKEFKNDTETKVVSRTEIPSDMMGLDIGPKSCEEFEKVISKAKTVIWNGPMGVFEMETFENGTKSVALAMANNSGTTIIGGGDSAAAVLAFGLSDKMSHISTGGGASLKFLEGGVLPGVEIIENK